MPSQITNIVLHHSATDQLPIESVLDGINNSHKKRGFPKGSMNLHVGYHYLIDLNGRVLQTRNDSDIGAHCREEKMNYKSLGICLIGNFEQHHLTERQEKALVDLLTRLIKKYNIDIEAIKPHNNYKSTACSGANFIGRLDIILGQCKDIGLNVKYADWQIEAKEFAIKNELIKNWDQLPFSVEQTIWIAQVLKNYTNFIENKNK